MYFMSLVGTNDLRANTPTYTYFIYSSECCNRDASAYIYIVGGPSENQSPEAGSEGGFLYP